MRTGSLPPTYYFRSPIPNDLREVDPRQTNEPSPIDRVLALVEMVCGPDSDVHHMLTDPFTKKRPQNRSGRTR